MSEYKPISKLSAIMDVDSCDSCGADLLFCLTSPEGERNLDLKVALACLKFAEDEGQIKPLGEDWWHAIYNKFGKDFIRR